MFSKSKKRTPPTSGHQVQDEKQVVLRLERVLEGNLFTDKRHPPVRLGFNYCVPSLYNGHHRIVLPGGQNLGVGISCPRTFGNNIFRIPLQSTRGIDIIVRS